MGGAGSGRGRKRRSDAKLSDDQVRSVYRRYVAGEVAMEVAVDLGVSRALISQVIRGRSYPDVFRSLSDEERDAIAAASREHDHIRPMYRCRSLENRKLTEQQVAEIKGIIQWAKDHPLIHSPNMAGVGEKYGVSRESIRLIRENRMYRWIEPVEYEDG